MDLDGVVFGRRTVRRFLPDPVPDTTILGMIEAATRAPSAHNRQPWRFHVVRDAAGKARLAKAMGDRLRADRSKDGDDAQLIHQDVERSSGRINGAPALIAVCLTLDDMDTYPDMRRNEAEFLMAVQSTAMAAQILLLKAQAEGLGACWMCAPLFCAETVSGALDLPASWQPQGLILLGYPAEPGKIRERKKLGEIVRGIALP
ncbi:MAG TPA: nitroreductase family protein [Alphaproteobacteria bacterium]|jgi:F420 biosynthesis protein FbiB-like protein|nr:nitroreductase family protein [Alphaproteobacteria bacterium]